MSNTMRKSQVRSSSDFEALLASTDAKKRVCRICETEAWRDKAEKWAARERSGKPNRSRNWLYEYLVKNESFPFSSPWTLKRHLRECLGVRVEEG